MDAINDEKAVIERNELTDKILFEENLLLNSHTISPQIPVGVGKDVSRTEVPNTDFSSTESPNTDVLREEVWNTNVLSTESPNTDVSSTEVSNADVSNTEVPNVDVLSTEATNVDVSSTEIPNADVATMEVTKEYVSSTEVSNTDVSSTEAPNTEVATTEVATTKVPNADVSSTEVPNVDVSRTEVPITDVSRTEVPNTDVSSTEVQNTDVSSTKGTNYGFFSCPPNGQFGTMLSWVAFSVIFYTGLFVIVGRSALPRGNIFSLVVLIITAQLGGNLAEKIKLPPLLGMLIVGILLRSVPYIDIIGENIDSKWSATIRKMALVVILTRAGLGLDAKALRKLSVVVIRVGIVPNLVEMLVGAVASHYLLNFPWLWSFLLGFLFSAVSPSVVVPCMLNLADRQLGLDKGVPTLIIAALSIDNALSISGIGVFLGIIFSSGSVVWQGFKGPVEVLVGIGWGIIVGILCWNLPNRFEKGYPKFRFFFLFFLGLLSVFGSNKLNFGGAGSIGCLTTAFVAEIGWRNQGWSNSKHPVKNNFNFIWKFFQPLLFGLIGTEIQLSALNGMTVAWGLLTLVIGLVCRIATCFLVVQGSVLNAKEKLFVSLAWLPKATIQAAFGSAALDTARSMRSNGEDDSQDMIYGRQVLTLAVLAIIFAAPIGAILITLTGPKLLTETPNEYLEDSENGNSLLQDSRENAKNKPKS